MTTNICKSFPITKLAFLCLIVLSLLASSCDSYQKVTLGRSNSDIVFVSYQPRNAPGWVYLLDIDNKRWSQPVGAEYSSPAPLTWSPDGQALAFTGVFVDGMEGIMLLNEQGHIATFKPCSFSPAWSPDGQHLAFHKDCGGSASLGIVQIDGAGERELVADLIHHVAADKVIQYIRLSWSPDGRYIAYDNQDASGDWYIWTVDIEGGIPSQVTPGRHPAWLPLGDEIAFDRDGDIWAVSVDDGTERKLIDISIHIEWPAWSPDGQQLVFEGGQGTETEIYLINRDGSGLDRLTDNSVSDQFPAWRP